MIIEPLLVNYKKTKCIGRYGDKAVLGYWVEYKWNLLIGYAYLFPYGNNDKIIINKKISVETAHETITDFRKIVNTDGLKPFLKTLDSPGNYYVLGEVEAVYNNEENGKIECVYIIVDDVSFALDNDEIQNNVVKEGDMVQFTLIELELYDEGYHIV